MATKEKVYLIDKTNIYEYNKDHEKFTGSKMADLSAFTKFMQEKMPKSQGFTTPILPRHTVYFEDLGDTVIVVQEFLPNKYKINYLGEKREVELPYVQFYHCLLRTSKGYVFSNLFITNSKVSVTAVEKTRLYQHPLPNTHMYDVAGLICMSKSNFGTSKEIPSLVQKVYSDYWNSSFNDDLGLLEEPLLNPCGNFKNMISIVREASNAS
jgi:hypothetical protein